MSLGGLAGASFMFGKAFGLINELNDWRKEMRYETNYHADCLQALFGHTGVERPPRRPK